MPNVLTSADRQRFARARLRGREDLRQDHAVIAARYDWRQDAFDIVFRSGKAASIPRALVPELTAVPVSMLMSISVSPAGDAICWRALDIDVDVRGLVERTGLEI